MGGQATPRVISPQGMSLTVPGLDIKYADD